MEPEMSRRKTEGEKVRSEEGKAYQAEILLAVQDGSCDTLSRHYGEVR